jgi:two-component system phosphate regulon sensor histidine kinase PhoR
MAKQMRIADPLFMVISILVIAGFQAYWIKNNYDREKRNLEIKTNVLFQETMRELQGIKLRLKEPLPGDSLHKGQVRIFVDADMPGSRNGEKNARNEEFITTVNTMRDKLLDSVRRKQGGKPSVFVAFNKDSIVERMDSETGKFEKRTEGNHIIRFLYGIDSLQDSLRIPEIVSAYGKKIQQEKLSVPFTITRTDSAKGYGDEPGLSDITVGFAHPKTYHLALGNTFPYLFRKISGPLAFSLFLVGLTILSFILLYRTLLKQQRLAEIKNEFISNITHELKTPLATVSVAIEALRNFNAMEDPQRTKEYLDISSGELQRLGLLVDRVLKLSMFENRQIELKKESFDLKAVTEEVLATMKLQFEKYRAAVSLLAEGGHFWIEADKLHITSVLYNLLDNALKYSRGNPVIRVTLVSKTQHVILSVQDNGIGIAPAYKGKVFDKFFRVPTGDTHNVKGYGLGLSYVREVLARHQGFVEVNSEPGKGSIFMAHIPYREAPVIWFDEKRRVRKKTIKL